MKANGAPAEADLMAVANGDFSRLSSPILVACRNQEQFEDFVWKNGLMCSEVRRVGRSFSVLTRHRLDCSPPGKILLLLPKWDQNHYTAELVNWWVYEQDRYTVQLRAPRPLVSKPARWRVDAALATAAVVLVLVWLVTR